MINIIQYMYHLSIYEYGLALFEIFKEKYLYLLLTQVFKSGVSFIDLDSCLEIWLFFLIKNMFVKAENSKNVLISLSKWEISMFAWSSFQMLKCLQQRSINGAFKTDGTVCINGFWKRKRKKSNKSPGFACFSTCVLCLRNRSGTFPHERVHCRYPIYLCCTAEQRWM